MSKIILNPEKEKFIFKGDPLIFSGAIKKVTGNPNPADLVEIYSAENIYLGLGVYNPHSSYRVRILNFNHHGPSTDLATLISEKIKQAIKTRAAYDLPNAETNAYRLFNSEADGLSGLTLDIFNQHIVASITAYWFMHYEALVKTSLKNLGFEHIIWRPQVKALAQDGWKISETETLEPCYVTIKENDISYKIDIGAGQKTGFYCDQRENRLFIRSLAQDKTVLDCCCFNGSFALNARRGGAKKVTAIDSSAPAIEQAIENANLNNFSDLHFQVAKVEDYLSSAENIDLLILDPPKLAASKTHLKKALHRYSKLNQLALKALAPNGYLFTCSCSNAVTERIFNDLIQDAARKVGRKIKIITRRSAGPDHPIISGTIYGNYLKAILVQVLG